MKPVWSFQGVMIREYPLDRPVSTIGRHEHNHIVFDRMGVSGRQARVAVDSHSVVLTDLTSTIRTFVNGRRVERTELRPNDWITSASTS